ncbi:MAG: hypothetical protein LBU28_08100 [Spirochaetaceae bacterium]|nr:hypothetical protein [Spirochaetaceae bacterium]
MLIGSACLASCAGKAEEGPVRPPPTPPLTRSVIGYGVVSASYTQVFQEPVPGESLGYLRRGSLVRVLERRRVSHGGLRESWILVEGNYRGWLKEEMLRIYDNEARARTAAESIPP